MSAVTLPELLEAGTHFGHQTKRWNPKMKRFILCPRNGIYIIDLNKTIRSLEEFVKRIKDEVQKGGRVLFVGTKKQIKDCVREEASRCNMPYVTERWLGGMLTNFQTIRQSVARLEKIEKMETDGTFEALTKKERQTLLKRKEKLSTVLTGVRTLRKLPAVVFVVDVIKEHIAVAEANRLKVPVGAIVDTNCDPDIIDYPIPGNDDAIKSVQLITKTVADAILSVGGVRIEEMVSAGEEPELTAVGPKTSPTVEAVEEVVEAVATEEGEDPSKPLARKHRIVRRKMGPAEEED